MGRKEGTAGRARRPVKILQWSMWDGKGPKLLQWRDRFQNCWGETNRLWRLLGRTQIYPQLFEVSVRQIKNMGEHTCWVRPWVYSWSRRPRGLCGCPRGARGLGSSRLRERQGCDWDLPRGECAVRQEDWGRTAGSEKTAEETKEQAQGKNEEAKCPRRQGRENTERGGCGHQRPGANTAICVQQNKQFILKYSKEITERELNSVSLWSEITHFS